MVPHEVVLFLTLEVVPKLTLERPKSGTKTNSPAYIYIYIYLSICLSIYLSLSLSLSLSRCLYLLSFSTLLILYLVSVLAILRCFSHVAFALNLAAFFVAISNCHCWTWWCHHLCYLLFVLALPLLMVLQLPLSLSLVVSMGFWFSMLLCSAIMWLLWSLRCFVVMCCIVFSCASSIPVLERGLWGHPFLLWFMRSSDYMCFVLSI